jgi:hypothetical protein
MVRCEYAKIGMQVGSLVLQRGQRGTVHPSVRCNCLPCVLVGAFKLKCTAQGQFNLIPHCLVLDTCYIIQSLQPHQT